jgi:acetylornithine/succinyldiaminopimelate/putrescine aminotransferase
VVRLLPSYVITEQEIDEGMVLLDRAIAAVAESQS